VRYTATGPVTSSAVPAPPAWTRSPAGLRGEQAGIGYAATVKSHASWSKWTAMPCRPMASRRASWSLRCSAADGKPLAKTVLATIEHSGGRLLLPGARTDEFGPRGWTPTAPRPACS
jgi:hypothetical protein